MPTDNINDIETAEELEETEAEPAPVEELFEGEPDTVAIEGECAPDKKGEELPDGEEVYDLEADLDLLSREFSELEGVGSIAELEGALRYGELRELGLSPREAYLASRPRGVKPPSARAHLHPAAPSAARRPATSMPRRELKMARELFAGMSDTEIEMLYKRVTQA